MNKNRVKIIGSGLGIIGAFVAIVMGVNTAVSSSALTLFHVRDNNSYSLTLNSSNSVSSSGDHDMYTPRGGKVTFTYSGVTSASEAHTKINEDGYVVNKDIIHSIEFFTANFTGGGTLKARIAYNTNTWGDYFELASGTKIEIGSHPYYLEMKAFGGSVTLTSAKYEFSCQVNSDAETVDNRGSYDIAFKKSGSNGGTTLNYQTIKSSYITSGVEYIYSVYYPTTIYAGTGGLLFGNSSSNGSIKFNFNYTDYPDIRTAVTSITFDTSKYGSDTGVFNIYINSGDTITGTINPSTGGTVAIPSNVELQNVKIETSNKRAYLAGMSLNYGSIVEPGQPDEPDAYETGFGATDANDHDYTTNSIFANDNALSVYSIMSNEDHNSISSSDYTYVIKDSNNNVINPTVKFPTVGIYTLTVSYGNYVPVVINLYVGEYVYIVDVAASMSTRTFNTADTLAAKLAGNITASLEYSNETTSDSIAYADFASHGIGVKLLTPKGITYDQSLPFGTAGSWTVKVYSLTDEDEQYYNISITVNAIPVVSISLNETSKTLYPEDTLQLVATVNPNNATNSSIVWTSNNEAAATVDENGLVTAVAVGGTTITATAADGSGVYGSCVVTVVARPAEPEWEKITDGSTIKIGDVIVIAYESGTTSVELKGFDDGTTTYTYGLSESYATKPAGLYTLTVTAGFTNSSYGLKHDSEYLSWSSGNSLTTVTSIQGNNDSWTFGSTPSIKNAADSTRIIQYNTSSPRFACYTSNQGALTLYRQTNAAPVAPVYPTSIVVSGTNSITIGETSQLSVTYTPSDTNVKNLTFTSSNTSVATVSNTGLVTAVAQGNTTITVQAEAINNTTVSKTYAITVNPVLVTSVSLDTNSATVKVGKTVTLVPTVYPTNATNKAVTWSSSNTGVATVSNGVVTGVAAGNATITVRTSDGNKTATCTVVVQTASSGGEETFNITYSDLATSSYPTSATAYTSATGFAFEAYYCANFSSKMQFKASQGYIQSTEDLELQSVTINGRESNTLTVYGSNTAGSFSTEISGTNDVYDLTGYSYFKVARTSTGAAYCQSITVVTGTPTPTDPTSIIMSSTSAEIGIGGTKQLDVSYVPSNANQNKEVTWTSSNTNVATVSNTGLVSVKSTAKAGNTATITARLTNLTSIYATCTITVIEQTKDDHTVLIYLCGADLESENGLATGDIQEILKVSGQPSDVNIVIETGGASSWSSTYGISSTKLERYHVENKQLVKDASLNYASMGLTSTLQSFLEYGLNNFPAERTGLILWNHGGGMHGVCYDEKKSDDSLLNNEVTNAVTNARNNCGVTSKLEWIGYDACLMAVQDIAEFNSANFNYMIASEESEAGYGWDYDNWVDDLYAKKSTTTILKAICDSFISDNGGVNSSSGDQTLSYLDLSYASAYMAAWEAMAGQLQTKLTSSNKSTFNNAIINNVKHFADSDYDYFCLFDAKDFINKLASASAFSSFRIASSYTDAVLAAHANLVAYSTAQKGAGNAYGLCMYWCNNSKYSDVTDHYSNTQTHFSTWRSINYTYGTHK